jgi:hypothetical protein
MKLTPALVTLLTLVVPPSVHAAGPLAVADVLSGGINLQSDSMDAQVTLERGSVAVNASLTDSGPEGQVTLTAPGLFSLKVSTANGSMQAAACGVIGQQEIAVNGGPGNGVHLQFQAVADSSTACAQPTGAAALTMGPLMTFAQGAPESSTAELQAGAANWVRRLLILALISGLLFVFVPHLSEPLRVTAESSPWSRLGLGVCLAIALPVLGVIIFITGLPVGLWWMGLVVLMLFICMIAVSLSVSGLVLGAWFLDRVDGRVPTPVGLAAGLIVLTILGLLPVIGSVVNVLGLVYGAGALVLLPRARASAAAAAAAPVPTSAAPLGSSAPPATAEPAPPPASEAIGEPKESDAPAPAPAVPAAAVSAAPASSHQPAEIGGPAEPGAEGGEPQAVA